MTYLLDTVVLTDPFLPRPNARVAAWMEEQGDRELFTSVICYGEMWRGFSGFPEGRRRNRLERWLLEAERGTAGNLQVLLLDQVVATRWGTMVSELDRQGRRPPVADSLIAATALVHNLTVVTRNTRDFERCGVPVLNPWS